MRSPQSGEQNADAVAHEDVGEAEPREEEEGAEHHQHHQMQADEDHHCAEMGRGRSEVGERERDGCAADGDDDGHRGAVYGGGVVARGSDVMAPASRSSAAVTEVTTCI